MVTNKNQHVKITIFKDYIKKDYSTRFTNTESFRRKYTEFTADCVRIEENFADYNTNPLIQSFLKAAQL